MPVTGVNDSPLEPVPNSSSPVAAMLIAVPPLVVASWIVLASTSLTKYRVPDSMPAMTRPPLAV